MEAFHFSQHGHAPQQIVFGSPKCYKGCHIQAAQNQVKLWQETLLSVPAYLGPWRRHEDKNPPVSQPL
ncbi:hypothetical protein HanHA300_Chr16g0614441 [Helianthus annuus]|nr:hypothetical protein HanHA300_Chr16g0614441 [Helianthus annuus]